MPAHDFVQYFRQQIAAVRATVLSGRTVGPVQPGQMTLPALLYQKILLVSIIDCLAGFRYPKSGNRDRFTEFLRTEASWSDARLVSIPFLNARLEEEGLVGALSQAARERLDQFDPTAGNGLPIAQIDVPADQLLPLAVTEDERKAIDRFLHLEILYRYRNFLVHEFREPGSAMEVFARDGATPCYHGFAHDPRYFLVYPVGFFEQLAISGSDGLEKVLVAHGIDPYSQITDASRW